MKGQIGLRSREGEGGDRYGSPFQRAFASGVPYLVNVVTDPTIAYPRSTTGI